MEQTPENSTSYLVNETSKVEYGIGGLSAVLVGICGIVMVLIVCLKAYKTFIDRLVLYITISVFLFTVSVILQNLMIGWIESKVKESVFNGVCSAVGYLTTFTLWMMLFLLVISLHLFLLVAFQVKVSKYEKLIVVGIPIISAVIASVPFMTKSYGSSDYGCWIISKENNQNRSIAGLAEQIVLGYGSTNSGSLLQFVCSRVRYLGHLSGKRSKKTTHGSSEGDYTPGHLSNHHWTGQFCIVRM